MLRLFRDLKAARCQYRMASLRRDIQRLDTLTGRLDTDDPEQYATLCRAHRARLAKTAELSNLERNQT